MRAARRWRRLYAGRIRALGAASIFDSNRAVPVGTYAISTEQGNRYPGTGIVHLAVAFEVEAPVAPAEPVAVTLDPATHAPVTAAGTVAARVFPRPIGMRLDPVEHPLPEISSR